MKTALFFVVSLLLPIALLWADVRAVPADEDICKTDLTEEKLDNPPERTTKYEILKEPLKIKLTDVKLLNQRYVAIVRITLPFPGPSGGRITAHAVTDNGLRSLEYVDGTPLLSDGFNPSVLRDTSWLEQIFDRVPEDRRPPKELQEFFRSADVKRYLQLPGNIRDPEKPTPGWQRQRWIQILATSPEQATDRSRAFLTLVDQGFSRPIQVALFAERVKMCERLKEVNEKAPAAKVSETNLRAKLKDYEDFPPDLLAGLRVQQLQMEVDLAGVKARIATCERLLAAPGGKPERLQNIEDAKVAAEIELSGFEARRAKSAEFVAKVKDRNELTATLQKAHDASRSLEAEQRRLVENIRLSDADIAAFAPVQIIDDRVTIHPLEWTQ